MKWLILATLLLLAVWAHGVLCARWYRKELALRSSSGSGNTPNQQEFGCLELVSMRATRPRIRAELARAIRLGVSVRFAVAHIADEAVSTQCAGAVAAQLPAGCIGLIWDAHTLVLSRAVPLELDDLIAHPDIRWALLDTHTEEILVAHCEQNQWAA